MSKIDKGLIMRAAALLMIIQVLSRILGYARDTVMVNIFEKGFIVDAFTAAFSIPDFIYNIVIGGAITAAFIPVFSSRLEKGQAAAAWKASSIFSNWVLIVMIALLTAAYIFTEPLLGLLTQYSPEQMILPVTLARITMIQALFMAVSAISTGILQSHQHFTWPAIGMLLYNVFIIAGGVLLAKPIEAMWPGFGIAGFSVGVVLGGLVTFLVQIPTLKKVGFQHSFDFDTRNQDFRKMLKLLLPVIIGLSVTQINMLVTQYLATGLEEGVLFALKTANRFMQLPIGVFAASIAIAIFPTMTKQAANEDYHEMKHSMASGTRTILFLTVPASLGLIILKEPIVRLLYAFTEKVTENDITVISQSLLYYCIGLAAYGVMMVFLRGFYAIHNTMMPLLISAMSIGGNVLLSVLLVGPMGYRGLALAYSLAGILQCILLIYFLRRKIGSMNLRSMSKTMIQIVIACVMMGLSVWGAAQITESIFGISTKIGQLMQVIISIGVGGIVYTVMAALMKMDEYNMVKDIVKRRRQRKKLKDNNNSESSNEDNDMQ